MIALTLTELTQAIDGQLFGENSTIDAISTDSRALNAGDVFLALQGPNFDGHKFVQQAAEQGCSAVIVQQFYDEIAIAQVVVAEDRKSVV